MARYTTSADVQAQLGRTLTAEQLTYLDASVIPAAEEWVDVAGGRVYGVSSVVAEQLVFASAYTWLSTVPVVSVGAIRGYLWGNDASQMATVPPSYYSLVDARSGYLYLPSYAQYAHLEVDYTPDAAIPSRIRMAASIVAGVYMRTVLHPETEWLTEYSSGQDIRIKFKDAVIPEMVYELIGGATGSYVIA